MSHAPNAHNNFENPFILQDIFIVKLYVCDVLFHLFRLLNVKPLAS